MLSIIMKKNLNMNNLDYFNLKFENNETRIILMTVIILVIILLFRKQFNTIIERIIYVSNI